MVNLILLRGGSKTAATSKTERFVIIVNGFQSLTIITKCSIFDLAGALDPLLLLIRIIKGAISSAVTNDAYSCLYTTFFKHNQRLLRFCLVNLATLGRYMPTV